MRYRHDGFTARKRRKFLATVAKTGCIRDGCRAARVSSTTVSRWRDRDARFAGLLKAALAMASEQIQLLAWERGVTGIEEPVWSYGKQVGTRVRRSDSIFRMLMIAADPETYGRMGRVGAQAGAGAAGAGGGRRRISRERAREIRAKLERMLSDFNRRMGGDG
ncbi:MAG TPA: hypothetical protein VD887_10385 [Allosphingosinicella sp.]|nr:hypothetical protein [Allosphingosinicella sp.]